MAARHSLTREAASAAACRSPRRTRADHRRSSDGSRARARAMSKATAISSTRALFCCRQALSRHWCRARAATLGRAQPLATLELQKRATRSSRRRPRRAHSRHSLSAARPRRRPASAKAERLHRITPRDARAIAVHPQNAKWTSRSARARTETTALVASRQTLKPRREERASGAATPRSR